MPISAGLNYFAHVAEDAKPNRPPVILLHGAGGNHLSWPPQIRRLAGETIYALDLPGHGQSEGVGKQSIDAYADDVITFMQSLKIRAAVITGISMGGAIALTLALKYPGKVKALVLLGSGAKMRVAQTILENVGTPNTFQSAVASINASCFSENVQQNLLQLSEQSMLKIRPPVLLGDFLACNEFNVMEQLEKIKKPTLIVCGAEDKMMPPKLSEALRDGIAKSTLHILEGAGHMVMIEKPDEVADLLKKFLDGLPVSRRKPVKVRLVTDGEADSVQKQNSVL
ncbi:MAG: alpha/beta hydrolase [Anaerolineales bacterium]|nr:alpha/beta hydrolase [Anaerolineales bacterium]